MAEEAVVHIGENSPEYIAYLLMTKIATVEAKVFHTNPGSEKTVADRNWILNTYTECLEAALGTRGT